MFYIRQTAKEGVKQRAGYYPARPFPLSPRR
ncbi:hypothetical protein DET0196 [Dehalococcoides mccartyi 195]|uniref:Uncharacterized protein n=1 Tax=Dehalococcoides mccartyi (strain ATCC BAA-2266 / KCTC 15142 / 195) TaxID=243164 RepID=Q3ZA05_DEHM1|nr:hypothetical protein DET0196 [Dehalococcoides mccartyi 195]